MIDTRFSTALQIVIGVAVNEENGCHTTSQLLAASTNTNPSFVRKLLGPLRKGHMVKVVNGGRGGIVLCRPASLILVSEIYKAVVPDKKIWETRSDMPGACFVSRNIGSLSEYLRDEAEKGVVKTLAGITLQAAIEKLHAFDRDSSSRSSAVG